MAETSANTISVKALVDKASNQIIFIESDNDFIDVLFSFLTIPMGTIMRLAPNQSVPLEIGCIKNLYSSVKNMDVKHFRTEACRDMLLCPRNVAESQCRNLKPKIDNGEPTQYFLCSRNYRGECKLSYNKIGSCDCGGSITEEKNLLVSLDGGIFVKGLARLIIGDNLQVMPPLTLEGLSVFTELGVRNGNTTEELTFNVGSDEVLNLLICSLVSRTPLTETLLKNKPIRKLSNINQGINIEPQIVVDATDPEGNLSIKLIVSKSKKMVCYAEVGEDFVNLLFSFLTIPLGFVVKQMRDCALKGCINQLFKSVQDLDDCYLKSDYHKEMLLSPKLVPGFCYENHLLGTEEATYYYALGMLSTDKTLIASRISAAKKTRRSYYGEESAQTSIKSVTVMDPKSHNNQDKSAEGQGFLGGPAMFTVTDNLIIRPISLMFGLSLLNELKVPLTDIEVKIVHVRREESMADKSMDNIELKVLVNNVSNKVIFVESDGDFIDVLFSFLTIPMGTVIRLSHRSQPLGIGCMDNIYGSVESFDSQLFRTEECRAMLLRPRNRTEYLLDNLKLKFDDSEPTRYFMCSNPHCRIFRNSLVFSYYQKVRCPRCERLMDTETTLPVSGAEDGEVFVKGPARFIISDDLQVMPPFTSTSSSLVKNLGCTGWNSIEELTVNVGVDEVLKLLMCSLVSKMPLTETLLKHEPLPELSNENVDQEIYVESRMLGDATNEEEEKISIKLIVSKSRKMVCYAEGGEEFVNLLFSFLTLPLGFIVKQMQDNSMKGCIDQLYKSVQDLDEQCLKSNNHKKMLVSPKLLPGFGYKNHPLGIEEASYRLAVDTTLIHSNKQVKSVEFIDPKSHRNKDDNAFGFLKGPAMFMITDSLNVSPISAILGLSILCELNVPVTDIEVQVAQVGKKEALCLLVASFVCDSALTSVFLRKPNRGFGCLSFLI